jgi:acyl carrier protein phosphodiesterase
MVGVLGHFQPPRPSPTEILTEAISKNIVICESCKCCTLVPMNFLAHAYLSFDDPEILVGNMIADTLKSNQPDQYPPNIQKGIYLHRNIDHYTDHHELVKATRKVFYPFISHYALVISDVIYDHFLGVNWKKYHHESLFDFSQRSYKDLDDRITFVPERFQQIFRFMKEDNWFVMYSKREGIHRTIDRLSYRSKGFTMAKETIQIFDQHYDELEKHFLEFFPQLIQHSKEFLQSSS